MRDSTVNMFVKLKDFTKQSEKLLEVSTDEEFEACYNELEELDRRSLYFFIQDHSREIPLRRINIVLRHIGEVAYAY